jgi:Rieske Fe-S protein
MPTDRRTFLKHSCILCGGIFTQLTSCTSTLPIYNLKFSGNTLQVPVINFEDSDVTIVRDDQAAYDILLVKQSPAQYDAIYMRCSHGDYAVGTTSDGLTCPAHGSVFDYDGTVRKGPATEPLLRFPTEFDNNNGIITINIQALKI